MYRKFLTTPNVIKVILCLQLITFILFPLDSFSINSQEWWLPVLLAVLVITAVIQIIVQHSKVAWPWYLISFAQGFNIISRLMMLLPHATRNVEGNQVFNTPYVSFTILSVVLSALLLWYTELPEVRLGLIRE